MGHRGNFWGAPAGRGAEYLLWSVFRIPTSSFLDVPDPRAVILEGTFRDLQMAIRPRPRALVNASMIPGPLTRALSRTEIPVSARFQGPRSSEATINIDE